MIKRILVPLDPSPYSKTAVEVACAIARWRDAEITGLVVLDVAGIEKSIGPVPLGALHYAEHLARFRKREAEERIESLLADFREKCEQNNVAHREAEFQGSPSERIIQESMFYDAVVIGLRTHFRFETTAEPGDSLEELLDHTITPIYGVPAQVSWPLDKGEKLKVLIAFDGSFPAARALQRFTQMAIPELVEVTVLMADPEEEKARYYLDQAEAYLKAHSIVNVSTAWSSENIVDILRDEYLDRAGMVVLGAHSKRGLFDFMAGGLTRYLIEADKRVLLIAQ